MSATRRVFPETFKREAVDRVASSGLPVGRVAAELGLNETVLRRWVTRLGGRATENARLRRENERLRMERDILKKAALIFGSASR